MSHLPKGRKLRLMRIIQGTIDDEIFDGSVQLFEEVEKRLQDEKIRITPELIDLISKEVRRIMIEVLADRIAERMKQSWMKRFNEGDEENESN